MIRKQVYELTPEDLRASPVWEYALDEEGEEDQDECTVRPVLVKGLLNPMDGMFIVAASFKLADGSSSVGYLTPGVQGQLDIGTIQPAIITKEGQVSFWCGTIPPDSKHLAQCYELLGKNASQLFPLSFSSEVQLMGGAIAGTVPGFLVLEAFNSEKIRVVQ